MAVFKDIFVDFDAVTAHFFLEMCIRDSDKTGVKLLVFDEPTAVLTESEAAQLISVMKKISESGIAIIFITHRLDCLLYTSSTGKFRICLSIQAILEDSTSQSFVSTASPERAA